MKVNPCAACKVHAHARKYKIIEPGSAVIPNPELVPGWSPGDQGFTFWPKEVAGLHVLFANVIAIDETGLSKKSGTVVEIRRLNIEFSTDALCNQFVARPGGM